MKRRFFLVFLSLLILVGCSKPDLASEPPVYFQLSAVIELNGEEYPLHYSWEVRHVANWNEGQGWHMDWESSKESFVRTLDGKFCVIIWLPTGHKADNFHPNLALVELDDLRNLRFYPEMGLHEKKDSMLQLTHFELKRASQPFRPNPMLSEEKNLKKEIDKRHYGYLYGRVFTKDEWSRSERLKRLLGDVKKKVPLGRFRSGSQKYQEIRKAFREFNSRSVALRKKVGRTIGFKPYGDSWIPVDSGVLWYRQGLEEQSGPVWVRYGSFRFDQSENELLFDGETEELIFVSRFGDGALK
jgi:hypothetical protein